MNTALPAQYSAEQIVAWLRGLVTVAWADGQFSDTEKALIDQLVATELAPELGTEIYEPIAPEDLARQLGPEASVGENFLRTAVMVALADGLYSTAEDRLLEAFCQALDLQVSALESLRQTLDGKKTAAETAAPGSEAIAYPQQGMDVLLPVRHWLDELEMHDPRVARFLCKLIPPQCPFERDVKLFGRKVVHIPPLCKLNPLYEQLVYLRFRALSYLADDCKEDVSKYC
ncbi:Mo-dependent nitrogenase C-terminal domain-containing protein [Altericista sp. CCNU0014]|uniref:Mo-dependent nitrogenase C-terminal domain-containing protein n=1 Tax=Altericista sp. CCNU0014 TaxID=3082949 RepID=UPI00384E88BB